MIHVRNFRTPTLTATWSAHATTILLRELLKLAGWSDVTIGGDAAWTTCLVVNEPGGANGFQVAAASPRVVYDPLGRFTLAMETGSYSFILRGTLNAGAWKVFRYIDANHVEIDPDGAPPDGWVNETGIAGRIVNVNAARLAADAGGSGTALMGAPGCNLRGKVKHATTSSCLCYAQPKGGAGLATDVPAAGQEMANGTDTYLRFNCVLDGKNALIWLFGSDGSFRSIMWGELDNVDAGDTNPGFLWKYTAAAHVAYSSINMLSSIDAQITGYLTFMKHATGTSYTEMFSLMERRRLLDGRPGVLHLRRPKVVLDNVIGQACIRGKLPLVRTANYYLENLRPLDADGDWMHTFAGFVTPRNGPDDVLPIRGS